MILINCFYNIELNAQQGKVDLTFNTLDDGQNGDGFDNTVRTLFLQSDQNLIVGGDYLSLNGIPSPYLTRLKPDGSIDETFSTGTGFNGKIYASYIQPDGKIIVGGSFTTFNGVSSGRLIRLNIDGSYDATFNSSVGATTGIIYDISPQADGKIIIVGSFTKYNNVTVNRIARILTNGDLDPTFIRGSGSTSNITNARVLLGGKILITGSFTSFNGIPSNRMTRLLPDGRVDMSFSIGTGFNNDVNAISIQDDGKIILGGKFTSYNENVVGRIVRINEDGTVDKSFTTGSGFSGDAVLIIKINTFGNIMVGGSFAGFYNGGEVNRVCLLNPDGSLNNDFDIGSGPGSASVLALANDLKSSWYVGGSFSVFDGLNQGKLAKISADGDHDVSYLSSGIGFDNSVLKILPLPNKKTMVFGSFTKFNGIASSRITRILEDGLSDATFNSVESGANNLIKSGIRQSDGKLIFGGNFTKYNESISNRIARIFPDGAIDNTFSIGSGFNGQVYAIAIQPDQKIVVVGNFTSFNGAPAPRIVRLLTSGLRDTSFNVGLGADAIIEALEIQPDGKILIVGRFNSFDGNSYSRLVRLNPNGSIDLSFNIGTGFDKFVYAIGLQSDQKIILGGTFLVFNGTSQKRIVRLNSNGSLDATFESGTGFNKGEVRTILVQPDDKILVGGTFSGTYKTNSSLRLIRLEKTGNYDLGFESNLNNKIYTMGFSSDYRLIIGGDFNSISGISKHRIARLKLCLDSTTWDGLNWSNGFPSGGKEVIFKDNYANLTTSNVCSCTIEDGKIVSVSGGNSLGIEFSYTGTGSLILEDSASLYQSDDEMINTGFAVIKRNSSPILKKDYTYWGSPVNDQKLIDFSPNTVPNKYFSFDYEARNWFQENPSSNMIPGTGYIIQGPQNFSSYIPAKFEGVFKGIPNNGKIEIKLGNANFSSLIGNPYPSALDADVFLTKNRSKIKGTMYFWTHNTPVTNLKYSSDDYAVYNLLGGVGTRGALSSGVNETIPNGTIASGQAFFILSKGAGSAEFNNSMRIADRNTTFFKPVKNKNNVVDKNGIEKHRIWLNLKNSEGVFKQTLVGYIHGATNSYDEDYDAESINGNQFVDFYSTTQSKKLVIQGRALPFVQTDTINLGYKTSVAGNFEISIDHTDEFFGDSNVFIEDKDLKTTSNLKDKPYSFNTQQGTFSNRFVLKFTNEVLKNGTFENTNEKIFVSSKNKIIKVISTEGLIKELSVFDISGKLLYTKNNIENSEFQISNLGVSHQVLLIRVVLENGSKASKKIIL
ncbi:T9SS sorting signal type C domain-containing protein [Flavobacterium hibernum]|uniref:T9SS sorting signal type C domain-containing protein n=1 Tax=Flavobacterium hibernum TaxID=37752 RepID=UPI000DF97425|nr:T9SS sorting signal type C domain-containing protein [Flavobacterium hibernum]STO14288.1 delta-60 repeat domain [Flavobacterium hibernum]